MSFLHHSGYPYGGHAGIPMDHGPPIAHPAMANTMDGYLLTHAPYDMSEYYAHMPMMEDYEEYAENLSRPRLTKDQVDTLEAQFQAHPKPNSNVKRELAMQTNLTLPRVANWFQNRRAKAKQQRRQEEFERMQREAKEKEDKVKPKEEEADGQSERGQKSPARKSDGNESPNRKSLTPTQTSGNNKDCNQSSSGSLASRQGKHHQKTGSDVTRERSFASLDRALSAAVAARDQHNQAAEGNIPAGTVGIGFDVRQANMSAPSTATNTPQTSLNSAYSEWGSSRDSSIAWTPSQSPEGYEFGSLAAVPFASEDQLAVAHLDNPPNADIPASHSFGSMNSRAQQLWGAQLQGRPDVHPSESMYGPLPYSLQPPSASSSRRPSSSEELAETINGIGIQTTTPLPTNIEGAMWRRPEKELDLAARRKRPRPAAIGTTAHHRLVAPSAVSPNTRMPSFGAPHHHTLRHAKSSHNLGSRYAGVRKFSAPQRSPLGFTSFAEAAAAAGSEQKHKHRLHSSASVGNLAPPTPLTPEDLQQMLPTTTSDNQLDLASQHLTDSQGLFPVTQPMQINVASPPDTPLNMDMFSAVQYQGLAPPLSAPPQYATFTEYPTISSEPLTAVSWAVSTPDTAAFPASVQSQRQQQPPTYIYEQDEDEQQQESTWTTLSEEGSSLYGSTKTSATPPASTMTGEEQDHNMTQFHIHEFPKQQEAHRNVAQQLAPQTPKNYTFSNQTPSDF